MNRHSRDAFIQEVERYLACWAEIREIEAHREFYKKIEEGSKK